MTPPVPRSVASAVPSPQPEAFLRPAERWPALWPGFRRGGPRPRWARERRKCAGEGAAGLGSALVFVFERELKLGPVGDRAVLIQVNILLDDLSHPKIAERPGGGPDRLGGRVFP